MAGSIPVSLAGFDADVLVFQECPPILAEPSRWPAGWTAHAEGNICLASRWPLIRTLTDERVLTGAQGGTGNVVLFRLAAPGDSVDIAVVHLETPRKGLERLRYGMDVGSVTLNTLVRDVGSKRASEWIAARSGNAIIAGDFNLPVESRIFREHWSRCPDAFNRAGRGFGYTRVLPKFSIRIDHVLPCGSWQALSATIGPDLGSDHLPLVVDLGRR
jgi:endonuclease/exonuclease/phosphatase family metal-dependent hydrolase